MIVLPTMRGFSRGFDPSLLYAAKGQSSVLFTRDLTWGNIDFRSTIYSFTATVKRLNNNTENYSAFCVLSYYAAQSDNFAFGLQTNNSGSNDLLILYRLNNFDTLTTTTLAVGSTQKIVGICSSSGLIWKSKTVSVTKSQAPPQDSRMTIYNSYSIPTLLLTNVSWWKRALTDTEKDQYFDGTLPLFA